MPKLASAVLAIGLWASALAAQAKLADTTGYTSAAVSLRARPDPGARSIARRAGETRVRFSSCQNGWCQIAVNGLSGYLPRLSLPLQRIMEEWRSGFDGLNPPTPE